MVDIVVEVGHVQTILFFCLVEEAIVRSATAPSLVTAAKPSIYIRDEVNLLRRTQIGRFIHVVHDVEQWQDVRVVEIAELHINCSTSMARESHQDKLI